jgi:SAM-dependent methyltransferase
MIRATLFHESRVLADAELEAPHTRCLLCGSDAARAPVALIQRTPPVELLRCPDCEGASASRMPTPSALEAYYASYYQPAAAAQVTFSGVARFARHIRRTIDARAPQGRRLRVLDFGGGDGSIAIALARETAGDDAEIVVVDSGGVHAAAGAGISLRHTSSLDDAGDGFDVVIASAILEHIPESGAALQALLDRLGPDGRFYARTPWTVPMTRLRASVDVGFPGHVHDLGADFWARAAARHGDRIAVLRSRPSIVENDLRDAPLRALAAAALKAPAHLEAALRRAPSVPLWRIVGGWEVGWRRRQDGPRR